MTRSTFPPRRADAVAKTLDLDLNVGICHACLSVVSFALDDGNPAKIRGELMHMTPGCGTRASREHALAAVRRACERGVLDADVALADLELKGGRSTTARSIVRRLAADLSRRTKNELRLEALARDRLRLAPPELN